MSNPSPPDIGGLATLGTASQHWTHYILVKKSKDNTSQVFENQVSKKSSVSKAPMGRRQMALQVLSFKYVWLEKTTELHHLCVCICM